MHQVMIKIRKNEFKSKYFFDKTSSSILMKGESKAICKEKNCIISTKE
jgi:hypothetical protein